MRGPLALVLASALACASRSAERSGASAAEPAATPPPSSASAAPTSAAPLPRAPSPEPVAAVDDTAFERVLEAPVRAVAIDKEPHVSALGRRVAHVHDAKGWREEALPGPALDDAALALFYGRDYRLRLVGTRQSEAGLETLYYRWLPGGFRPAPDEIGRLGSTRRGGFVALLGTADPEVVCRPGDVCLVKRLSGWATVAAPAELDLVAIRAGGAWAVAGRTLLCVDADKRWKTLSDAGPWSTADALWVTADAVWVAEAGADRLHRFDGTSWQSSPSPTKAPRALWSAEPSGGLWLGGEQGLHRFDGALWRRVTAISGAVSAINGRSATDVWVGGSAGLFRTASR